MTEQPHNRRGLVASALAAIIVAAIYVILKQRQGPDLIITSDEGWQPDMRVAVSGEVISPGTYVLHGDARIGDLVTAAGGYTDHAARDVLNPAARVGDGQQYTIPTQSPRQGTATTRAEGATAPPPPTSGAMPTPATTMATPAIRPASTTRTSTTTAGKVNINTATSDELASLPAIGPTLAERIIEDRTAHGLYMQIEDLARVRGISARTVEQIHERITVGP